MSWGEIAGHLTRVMDGTPANHRLLNDPCARAYIRLRDIAQYLGIEYRLLTRVRRQGTPLNPGLQAKLSWYFHAELRGRIRKECTPDGEWHVVYQEPQAHADEARPGAAPAARALPRIVFTDQGPRLKV